MTVRYSAYGEPPREAEPDYPVANLTVMNVRQRSELDHACLVARFDLDLFGVVQLYQCRLVSTDKGLKVFPPQSKNGRPPFAFTDPKMRAQVMRLVRAELNRERQETDHV
jgi:hypothetical protein